MSYYNHHDHAYPLNLSDEDLAVQIGARLNPFVHSCEVIKTDANYILRVWYRDGVIEKKKPSSVSAKDLGGYIKKALEKADATCEVHDLPDDSFRLMVWPKTPYDLD